MPEIELKFNQGFPWFRKGRIHVKGFLHTGKGNYLRGDALADHFRGVRSFEELEKKIAGSNGIFSVIIEGKPWLMACDCIRMFPLFYNTEGDILVSDDPLWIAGRKGLHDMDPLTEKEFLATGYVTGSETLIRGIAQLQAGEILSFDKCGIQRKFWYTYRAAETVSGDYAGACRQFGEILDGVFVRVVNGLAGWTAVVPLSGGYDSRLIAAMLRKKGYRDVVCFTYGRKGNPEIPRSRSVAGKLGYPWHFIEYTPDLIRGYAEDPGFRDFALYSAGCVSMFFLQEYFAVKQLKKEGLIPGEAVFLPGHSGDFLGGSQMIKHGNLCRRENLRRTARRIFRIKYHLLRPGGKDKKRMILRIMESLREKDAGNDGPAWSVYEDWDMKEKLAKFNANSVNTFSWFGHSFMFPFWDLELVNFFRDLPLEWKVNKKLYDHVLEKDIFRAKGLNFPRELQPTVRQLKIQQFKDRLRELLPVSLNRLFMRRNDPIFYREITSCLARDLAVRGRKILIHGRSCNSLIVQWYVHYLHGILSRMKRP